MIRTSGLATLGDLYLRSTQWRAREDLFVDEQERMNGSAALQASLRLARAYADLGVEAGEVVAFLCRSSCRHAVAWFGAVLGGRITCNLHARETAAQIGEVLAWLDAKVVVHDEDLGALAQAAIAASGILPQRLCLGDDLTADATYDGVLASKAPWDPNQAAVSADAIAAVILSSGTTGKPKGIMHTHRSLLEGVKGGQLVFGPITPHTTALLYMQPSFAAWSIVTLPVVGGKGRVIFGGHFSGRHLLETCQRERATLIPLVPTMWRMVFAENYEAYDLSSLSLVTVSGEAPAQSDIDRLRRSFCANISCQYQSSEAFTGSVVLATTPDLVERGKIGSSGRPGVGVDVKIIDPAGRFENELAAGAVGEIALSGPSLALGYWRDPELSQQRFRDGWWRSGDLGRIDEDGYLWVVGRTDNVINTGGIKVSGEEIETALMRHPRIRQCAVVGRPDERFGRRVEAFCVVDGEPISPEELDVFLRETCALAGFKVPKVIHFCDQLPTGPTGKLLRRALLTGEF